eukprot:scaffold20180_cov28-Tisochrysis_lutea.AAC.3
MTWPTSSPQSLRRMPTSSLARRSTRATVRAAQNPDPPPFPPPRSPVAPCRNDGALRDAAGQTSPDPVPPRLPAPPPRAQATRSQ